MKRAKRNVRFHAVSAAVGVLVLGYVITLKKKKKPTGGKLAANGADITAKGEKK